MFYSSPETWMHVTQMQLCYWPLMLDLRRFGRRSEPTELETPCFWCQFLVSGVQDLDTSFW